MAIVDDQIAAGLALGRFAPPESAEIWTTSRFSLRIASGVIRANDTSSGTFSSLLQGLAGDGRSDAIEALIDLQRSGVAVLDPRLLVRGHVTAKRSGVNELAAEVIAAAEHTGSDVWLSVGNSQGTLASALSENGIRVRIWEEQSRGGELVLHELESSIAQQRHEELRRSIRDRHLPAPASILKRIVDTEARMAAGNATVNRLIGELRRVHGKAGIVLSSSAGYLWIPDQYALQCAAIAKSTGDRCGNPIFNQGQVWRYDVNDVGRLDDGWEGRVLNQHCQHHDEGQAPDYLPTEWTFIAASDAEPQWVYRASRA